MNNIPRKARFLRAEEMADAFLIKMNITKLPFAPLDVLRQMGIKISTYGKIANRLNCSYDEIVDTVSWIKRQMLSLLRYWLQDWFCLNPVPTVNEISSKMSVIYHLLQPNTKPSIYHVLQHILAYQGIGCYANSSLISLIPNIVQYAMRFLSSKTQTTALYAEVYTIRGTIPI